MRLLLIFLASFCAVGATAASAKQVEVVCTPKAYSCYNSPGAGYVCQWSPIGPSAPAIAQAYRDPNKQGENFDFYRARYQASVDRHILNVEMEFKVYFNGDRSLSRLRATLAAGNVIAEASGSENIDIFLRNNTYGRGYSCSSFQVID